MKLDSLPKLACVAYIAIMLGLAIGSVGQLPSDPTTPFNWTIVPAVLCMVGLPAVLAYFAGRHDARQATAGQSANARE